MARTRIALIGLGMAVDPHARSLLELEDRVEVTYAFSPTEGRRRAFAERFPFPTCESLETILADRSVDAVLILTPPNTHLDIVRRVAAAGKHVLLEKPIEITTARSEALVEACRAAGVKLGMVLQHRFRPAARRLARLIRDGELGELAGASASMRLWRPQSYYDEPGRGTLARDGGGVLLTQGIHTLDLYLSLAGPVAEVFAFAATTSLHRMETEDLVCGSIRFANGALGTVEATTAAYPGAPERIELIGAKGTARLEGTGLELSFLDGREVRMESEATAGGTGASPMDFPHAWHRDLILDFLDAIETGDDPMVTGQAALNVHRFIDALLESGRTGRPCAVGS
jgi:predicted dehydrogenase